MLIVQVKGMPEVRIEFAPEYFYHGFLVAGNEEDAHHGLEQNSLLFVLKNSAVIEGAKSGAVKLKGNAGALLACGRPFLVGVQKTAVGLEQTLVLGSGDHAQLVVPAQLVQLVL